MATNSLVTVPQVDESEVTEAARPLEDDDIGHLFGAEGTPPQAQRIATQMPAVRPATEDTAVAAPIDPRGNRRASAPLLPGGERYQLGEEIGRGGMGEVLSAHDVQIGRDVAIKRIHAAKSTHAAEARFLREARIQGRLEHPAIPPVYELGEDHEGRPYFAMRKLEGVTLAETLRDPSSPFTQQRLLRAFIEICNAVDLAHARRIVHRDLKPANILLGERGEVYVLDWGIARELDAPEAFAGAVVGTPGYMAPEQLRGERDLDERVDIYALGCILFEIVTRRTLHTKGDAGIEQTLRGEFPYDVEMPLELQTACRWATSVQRSQRIATARQLGDVVQRYLDGDRDLERRRSLARHHLSSAKAAFADMQDDEARRSIVMREAGKALALEPTLDGAAELIGRVMLEPPTTMPAAVHRELAAMDFTASRIMARLSISTSVTYLLFLVAFLVLGLRDTFYLTAWGATAGVMLVTSLIGNRYPYRPLALTFVTCLIVMVGLLARMFTPLLVAPPLATIVLSSLPFNPVVAKRGTVLAITAGALVATLGVWAAELLGWVSTTVTWDNGTLVLRSPVDGVGNLPATPFLFLVTAMNLVMASVVAYLAMRSMQRARDKLAVQAWHLRQLV